MIQSLWAGASGMQAQQLKVDTISNNLANVNTPGFKAARVSFQDLMYIDAGVNPKAGQGNNAGAEEYVQIGTGVAPGSLTRDFAPGALEQTGQEWDLAIDGEGFFRVKLADGSTGYTRDGSFTLAVMKDGGLGVVDRQGHRLLVDSDKEIKIPADATIVEVGKTGVVSAYTPGKEEPTVLGQIKLARFQNPAGLEAIGNNLYKATEASGDEQTADPGTKNAGVVLQGFIEGSNVQVVQEMVNLIVAQRAYELNARSIQSSDQMLDIANNLRR